MKKLSTILLAVLILSMFCACAVQEEPVPSETPEPIDYDSLWDAIATVDGYDPMVDVPVAYVPQYYEGLKNADVLGGFMKVAALVSKADEVVVIQLGSAEQAQNLAQGAIAKRLEYKRQEWSMYLPEQLANVEDAIVEVRGDHLIFIVHENAEDILYTIDQFIAPTPEPTATA